MTNGEVWQMPIEELDLAVRPYNCLKRSGINTVGDICRMTLFNFRHIRNLGLHGMRHILDQLHSHGIFLHDETWCNCTVCKREQCTLTINDFCLTIDEFELPIRLFNRLKIASINTPREIIDRYYNVDEYIDPYIKISRKALKEALDHCVENGFISKCPAYHHYFIEDNKKCWNCGFEQLLYEFINKEDYQNWMIHTVFPYRSQYIEKKKVEISDKNISLCNREKVLCEVEQLLNDETAFLEKIAMEMK